jgi:hypothetical protein
MRSRINKLSIALLVALSTLTSGDFAAKNNYGGLEMILIGRAHVLKDRTTNVYYVCLPTQDVKGRCMITVLSDYQECTILSPADGFIDCGINKL